MFFIGTYYAALWFFFLFDFVLIYVTREGFYCANTHSTITLWRLQELHCLAATLRLRVNY